MEPSVASAHEALRSVEEARIAANRHSQNNGVLLLVWGIVVLASLIGFDVVPLVILHLYSGTAALMWGPPASAGLMLPLVLAASLWSKRYLRGLPVEAGVPANPWMFVPARGGRKVCFAKGWWSAYHMVVLLGGMALGAGVAHALRHPCLLPGTMSLIGLVDAAPLLVTGTLLWRRAQGYRSRV